MKIITKIKIFISKQILNIKTYGIRELFRKFHLLIKFLAIFPIYIIAIVPCIIIRLIRPWIIIRIGGIYSLNYGNFALDSAMYYCKKKLKIDQPTTKYIDLLYISHTKNKFTKGSVYNKQLEKMWKGKLNCLPSYLLDPVSKVNDFIPGGKIHTIEIFLNKNERDVDNLIDKCQPLDFTTEEEIYGKKMLNSFGLKDDDKFVCLAVRDGAYQLRKIPSSAFKKEKARTEQRLENLPILSRYHDWSYHNYRNYDIDNFVLAAEELTRRGYYVFRMGVVVNKPLNSNNPKIIDYANSNLRSDFMDVYLGAKCSFCISTAYGFEEVPVIFGKPLAYIVVPIGDLRTHSEKYLILTKHHILKTEKRKLSFSEIFSHGVAYAYDTNTFEEKGIEVVHNTPEEIKDLAVEMVENLEIKKKPNPKDEELQKTFQSLLASNIKRIKERDKIKHPYHKFYGQIRSRFSTKFLRENKNWLR